MSSKLTGPAAGFAGLGRLFWTIAIFSTVVNLLMLTAPLYMLQVYDRVIPSRSQETLLALTILIAGLFAVMGVLDYVRGRVAAQPRGVEELGHRIAGGQVARERGELTTRVVGASFPSPWVADPTAARPAQREETVEEPVPRPADGRLAEEQVPAPLDPLDEDAQRVPLGRRRRRHLAPPRPAAHLAHRLISRPGLPSPDLLLVRDRVAPATRSRTRSAGGASRRSSSTCARPAARSTRGPSAPS